MVYVITYQKEQVKKQSFTCNIDPRDVTSKVTSEGNEYIVLWLVERQAFRSLRLDRIVSVKAVKIAAEKAALAKARKAYSNYKRTRG